MEANVEIRNMVKQSSKQKVFRVFLVRSFRAVASFDIEADTSRRAVSIAKQTAKTTLDSKKVRETATDNGWLLEDPCNVLEVSRPGHPSPKAYGTYAIKPKVYVNRDYGEIRYSDGRVVSLLKEVAHSSPT